MLKPPTRILAATDFSAPAQQAVKRAAQLVSGRRSPMHLVHVYNPLAWSLAVPFGLIRACRDDLVRDFALTVVALLPTRWFAFDNDASRFERALCLLVLAGWLALILRAAATHRDAAPNADVDGGSVRSLVALIAAGWLFVVGTWGIATASAIDTAM